MKRDFVPDWTRPNRRFISPTLSIVPTRSVRSLAARLKATARGLRWHRVYFALSCVLLSVAGYGYAKAWLDEKRYEAAVEHCEMWEGV